MGDSGAKREPPSTQRKPAASPRNPPVIGPIAGPKNGAAANLSRKAQSAYYGDSNDEQRTMAIPSPRSLALSTSATVPPALTRGLDPKAPARKRKIKSEVICVPRQREVSGPLSRTHRVGASSSRIPHSEHGVREDISVSSTVHFRCGSPDEGLVGKNSLASAQRHRNLGGLHRAQNLVA